MSAFDGVKRERSMLFALFIVLASVCHQVQARMGEVTRNGPWSEDEKPYCPCRLLPKPGLWDKALMARWLAHSLEWGTVTTISSRSISSNTKKQTDRPIVPFGNIYSFVDGPCDNATGVPYFYGTYMDQTFQDIEHNPHVSLSLSEASLATVCGGADEEHTLSSACDASARTHGYYGDVESPVCARLTLTGRMVVIPPGTEESEFARRALFQRHPDMEGWVRLCIHVISVTWCSIH